MRKETGGALFYSRPIFVSYHPYINFAKYTLAVRQDTSSIRTLGAEFIGVINYIGIVEYIYPESNEAILLHSPRKIILKSTLSPDSGASLLIYIVRPLCALVEQ